MRIHIVAVGRMRRDALATVFDDYRKRSQWAVSVREISDRKASGGADAGQKDREGEQLLAAVPDGATVVVLDEHGRDMTSPELASVIGDWRDRGLRDIAFLIGGADGHSGEVLARADITIRFGRLTWPHLMARAMLMEQIYRVQTLLSGHPYHRV